MFILRRYNCLASDIVLELLLVTHDYYLLCQYCKRITKRKAKLIFWLAHLDDNTKTMLQYIFYFVLNDGYRAGYNLYNEIREQDKTLPDLSFIDYFVLQVCLCMLCDRLDELKGLTCQEFSEIINKLHSDGLVFKKRIT